MLKMNIHTRLSIKTIIDNSDQGNWKTKRRETGRLREGKLGKKSEGETGKINESPSIE